MQQSTEKTVISLIKPGSRAMYAAIAAIVVAAIAVSVPERGVSAAGALISAICILAACYEERWVFDYRRETASFKNGFLFLAKHRSFHFREISAVHIERFAKGFAKAAWARVSLELMSGERLIIECAAEKKSTGLISTAESLGTFFQSYRKQAT